MEQINNHSPLPWREDMASFIKLPNGDKMLITVASNLPIVKLEIDNASFIVTACNSYYPDQETISALTERVKELEDGLRNVKLEIFQNNIARLRIDSDLAPESEYKEGYQKCITNVNAIISEYLKLYELIKLTPKNNGE